MKSLLLTMLALIATTASVAAQDMVVGPLELRSGPAARRGALRVVAARSRPNVPRATPFGPPAPVGLERAASAPTPGLTGPRPTVHDLSLARSLFERVSGPDRVIGPAEARRAGLGPRLLAGFDLDPDGVVTADEFVVGYQALVRAAGAPVDPSLLAEATRIEAERHARAAALGPAAARRGPGR